MALQLMTTRNLPLPSPGSHRQSHLPSPPACWDAGQTQQREAAPPAIPSLASITWGHARALGAGAAGHRAGTAVPLGACAAAARPNQLMALPKPSLWGCRRPLQSPISPCAPERRGTRGGRGARSTLHPCRTSLAPCPCAPAAQGCTSARARSISPSLLGTGRLVAQVGCKGKPSRRKYQTLQHSFIPNWWKKCQEVSCEIKFSKLCNGNVVFGSDENIPLHALS